MLSTIFAETRRVGDIMELHHHVYGASWCSSNHMVGSWQPHGWQEGMVIKSCCWFFSPYFMNPIMKFDDFSLTTCLVHTGLGCTGNTKHDCFCSFFTTPCGVQIHGVPLYRQSPQQSVQLPRSYLCVHVGLTLLRRTWVCSFNAWGHQWTHHFLWP